MYLLYAIFIPITESHKYTMVSVHKGDYLLVRSAPCGDPVCEGFQSQCTTMRAVYKGLTTTTYAEGTAQMHWGTTPMGHWALYNVKENPECQDDLSRSHPELVASMAGAYDNWWEDLYPTMIEPGGDLGDPLASANASARAKQWKGPTSDVEAKKIAESNTLVCFDSTA